MNPTTGAVSPAPAAGVDWAGCDLHDSDLRFADLSGANLDGADLNGADMNTVNLSNATLQGADLQGAYMINVPRRIKAGTAYYLNAQEDVGTGFMAVPAVGSRMSREKVLFR